MPRHGSVQSLVNHLTPNPNLPEGAPADLAALTAQYRDAVLALIGDSPETAAGLRKLLEAKDCFVRQALDEHRARADELPSPPVDLRDHARATGAPSATVVAPLTPSTTGTAGTPSV